MDGSQTRQLLEGVRLFRGIPAGELGLIAHDAQEREIEAGDTFFAQGALADTFYVLSSGLVKLTQATPSSAPVLLGFVAPGEFLSPMSTFELSVITRQRVPCMCVGRWRGRARQWRVS